MDYNLKQKLNIACFGEVLWDVFSTQKKIGGAPLNVALRLQSLNNNVAIISRVGDDKNGKKLIDYVKLKGLDTNYIQIDKIYNTGIVNVKLNDKGAATYNINYPSAWDKIEIDIKTLALVQTADAFIYGSLVARDKISKKGLFTLLKKATFKIFDVNLRTPYYTKELLIELMQESDFIKFNHKELFEISTYLGSKYQTVEQNIKFVADKTDTKQLCVTKGKHGAVLFYNKKFYYNIGYQIKVKDTVGTGDSFLAALMSQLLSKRNPQLAIDFACAIGALVAQSDGANPNISVSEIKKIMKPKIKKTLI